MEKGLSHSATTLYYFSQSCGEKVPDKLDLRKEGFPLAYGLKGHSPQWRGSHAVSSKSWSQEAESEECFPALFSLYSAGLAARGTVLLPTFRVSLLACINTLHHLPPSPSTFCQVDD